MDKFTYKLVKQEKNKFEFEVKASKESFEEVYEVVYKEEAAKVKIAGFRPGKAPRAEVEKRISIDVINRTINKLLPQVAYEILVKEDLNPISSVQYDLKNINEDKSIDFTMSIVDTPKIDIAKLKKIKVEEKVEEVKDDEVEMVMKNIIQSTLPEEDWKPKDEKAEFVVTDELVAKLGYEDEKSVEGLKKKVKETLERVKKEQAEEEYTLQVLKEAVKVSDFLIPEDLVEDEVHHREHHFVERLENLKLDMDSYLKTQNKTLEDIQSEWRKEITESAGIDILAISVAKQENLVPTEEELDSEIDQIEDEITRIRYKSDERLREQMRTTLTRNRGVRKVVEIVRGDKK